jgi:hypothetical protein
VAKTMRCEQKKLNLVNGDIPNEVVEVFHQEEATLTERDEIWNFSTNIIIIFPKSHPSYFKKIGDGPINMALSK